MHNDNLTFEAIAKGKLIEAKNFDLLTEIKRDLLDKSTIRHLALESFIENVDEIERNFNERIEKMKAGVV